MLGRKNGWVLEEPAIKVNLPVHDSIFLSTAAFEELVAMERKLYNG